MAYFWALSSNPLSYRTGFYAIPQCFNCCTFLVSFQIKKCEASDFIIFCQVCFDYLEPLEILFEFLKTSLLECKCFTMVCQFLLYNKVNQLYTYIYSHISSLLCLPPTLPIPPLQVVAKHGADLPVLCSCFPLAIYFTFGSVYMSMLLSHFVPAYPSPSPCPQGHSLRLRPYSCPAPKFIRTIFFFFLDFIYMCQHMVFVFLFLNYFTLYDRLQVHPPHYK